MSKGQRIKAKHKENGTEKIDSREISANVFSRIYDKMFPPSLGNQYTKEDNTKHTRIVIIVMTIACAIIISSISALVISHIHMTSSCLIIPASSYTSAQEDTVISSLSEMGFSEVSATDNGIAAKGSEKMVKAYIDSYYEKFVEPCEEVISQDWGMYGIYGIHIYSDENKIEVQTLSNDISSEEFSTMFKDQSLQKSINSYASWLMMSNAGETPLFSFVKIAEYEPYFEEYAATIGEIIGQVESLENQEEEQSSD